MNPYPTRMKRIALAAAALVTAACAGTAEPVDRPALVSRNNPHITQIDTLASLTVGNGEFAFTVDVTGLQTLPDMYALGVPLGTQSQWGWHSFPNPQGLRAEETLKEYDFGRGRKELYAVQFNEPGRQHDAAEWYRINPHRLHLGTIGFAGITAADIDDIDQRLDMWDGIIDSHFSVAGRAVDVQTACDPDEDRITARIATEAHLPLAIEFSYPTGGHADDARDMTKDDLHTTRAEMTADNRVLLTRQLDEEVYYVELSWEGEAEFAKAGPNRFLLTPASDTWAISATFLPQKPDGSSRRDIESSQQASRQWWNSFWQDGAAVDFSRCTDPRAAELERRVVLSQYLLACQCAGSTPPQETGLTYNSWFGKFHLEMIWWHQSHFALWGHEQLLARTLKWYAKAAPAAREIARRQGFDGLRWMKMTDPSATEAPSKVGSFLIWQQPHIIYLAELLYRANPSQEVIDEYYDLVQQTAEFMYSFAEYDGLGNRYILRGAIPAQETLRADETVNPPFELAYWHFALTTANKWRERRGERRNLDWEEMVDKLSPLAAQDGLYLAAETATDTYKDIRFTSDHMAVLAALGVLPESPLVRRDIMQATFDWIYDNWNWGRTWGWDYPTTAMNAVRLGQPEKAVDALMMDKRTNTYLPNGHNYQDKRLRCYLPGNGGLLTTVALMCAGYDGCTEKNPGFPKDGTWDVRWEGLKPMP